MKTFLYISVISLLFIQSSCCGHEDKPARDPSKVIVVCANDGGAANQQDAQEFDSDNVSATATVTESNVCEMACLSLKLNKCRESTKLPEGKDCVENCRDIRKISNYDPFCVAKAKSADTIRSCKQATCTPL